MGGVPTESPSDAPCHGRLRQRPGSAACPGPRGGRASLSPREATRHPHLTGAGGLPAARGGTCHPAPGREPGLTHLRPRSSGSVCSRVFLENPAGEGRREERAAGARGERVLIYTLRSSGRAGPWGQSGGRRGRRGAWRPGWESAEVVSMSPRGAGPLPSLRGDLGAPHVSRALPCCSLSCPLLCIAVATPAPLSDQTAQARAPGLPQLRGLDSSRGSNGGGGWGWRLAWVCIPATDSLWDLNRLSCLWAWGPHPPNSMRSLPRPHVS